jgi:hypothetical protein
VGERSIVYEDYSTDDACDTYVNVQFFFSSLAAYNGAVIDMDAGYHIRIWEGYDIIKEFSLLDVPEFREALMQKMAERESM